MAAVAVAAILAAGAGTAVGGLFLLVLPRPSELVLSVCSASQRA